MKDRGIVVSTDNRFARVEVACLEACQECSTKSLCIGQKDSKGLLSVKNPLDAKTGDHVLIEIPDSYSKALIVIFGVLLLAILAGMGLGFLASLVLPVSPSSASLIGLLLGIACAIALLSLRFKRGVNTSLYPEIIEILHQGGHYG